MQRERENPNKTTFLVKRSLVFLTFCFCLQTSSLSGQLVGGRENEPYLVNGGPQYDAMVTNAQSDSTFQRVRDSLVNAGYQIDGTNRFGIQWDGNVSVTLMRVGYISAGGTDTVGLHYYIYPNDFSLFIRVTEDSTDSVNIYPSVSFFPLGHWVAFMRCFNEAYSRYLDQCRSRVVAECSASQDNWVEFRDCVLAGNIECRAEATWNAISECTIIRNGSADAAAPPPPPPYHR